MPAPVKIKTVPAQRARTIAEREARFEVVDRIRSRMPSVPDTEVEHDVVEALRRVRRRRRA